MQTFFAAIMPASTVAETVEIQLSQYHYMFPTIKNVSSFFWVKQF